MTIFDKKNFIGLIELLSKLLHSLHLKLQNKEKIHLV